MVKLEIQMTRKALAKYLYGHAYSNLSGVVSVIICLVIIGLGIRNAILGGDTTNSILYIAIGLLLLSHTHITIFFSTKRQMKDGFAKPITYTLEKERLLVEAGGQQVEYSWDDLIKVTKQAGNLLVHSGYRNAFIWPLDEIGDQYDEVIATLKEVMGEEKVKVK